MYKHWSFCSPKNKRYYCNVSALWSSSDFIILPYLWLLQLKSVGEGVSADQPTGGAPVQADPAHAHSTQGRGRGGRRGTAHCTAREYLTARTHTHTHTDTHTHTHTHTQ